MQLVKAVDKQSDDSPFFLFLVIIMVDVVGWSRVRQFARGFIPRFSIINCYFFLDTQH